MNIALLYILVKKKHRERAKRPTSPYSTDSNYSTVQVPHKPYPKSERKRQLQQYGRRNNSDNEMRNGNARAQGPPTKAKPSHGIPNNSK